ncbi:MAG: DUF58 domain-containing protein [Candidatus Tectomicrobia bacterium]
MIETILEHVCRIPYWVSWLTSQQRLGQRQSHIRGGGLEFNQIKVHQAGEGIRRVNWAATARHGGTSLFVNSYYEEKDLLVMLLVDLSASMDFGSRRVTKKGLAAEISASLVYSALAHRDRVGLLGFTSDVACYFPPRQSRVYQWMIPEAILHFDSTRAQANFWAAATGLDQYLKRRALVFLVSDYLTDDVDDLSRALSWLQRKHDLISLHVVDPRETGFPSARGSIVARDLETGKVASYNLSRRNQRSMAAMAEMRQERLQHMMQQLAVAHVTVTPDSDYAADITQMFLTFRGRGKR